MPYISEMYKSVADAPSPISNTASWAIPNPLRRAQHALADGEESCTPARRDPSPVSGPSPVARLSTLKNTPPGKGHTRRLAGSARFGFPPCDDFKRAGPQRRTLASALAIGPRPTPLCVRKSVPETGDVARRMMVSLPSQPPRLRPTLPSWLSPRDYKPVTWKRLLSTVKLPMVAIK
jgi:hypothetical protein